MPPGKVGNSITLSYQIYPYIAILTVSVHHKLLQTKYNCCSTNSTCTKLALGYTIPRDSQRIHHPCQGFIEDTPSLLGIHRVGMAVKAYLCRLVLLVNYKRLLLPKLTRHAMEKQQLQPTTRQLLMLSTPGVHPVGGGGSFPRKTDAVQTNKSTRTQESPDALDVKVFQVWGCMPCKYEMVSTHTCPF